jgi:hypothetical protein
LSTADEFREKARGVSPAIREDGQSEDEAVWLRIAESWLKMAQEADPRVPKRKQ